MLWCILNAVHVAVSPGMENASTEKMFHLIRFGKTYTKVTLNGENKKDELFSLALVINFKSEAENQ